MLASCYRRSIEAARGFEGLAFSAIFTGAYGFPAPESLRIAVESTVAALVEDAGALKRACSAVFTNLRPTCVSGVAGRERAL